MRIEVGRRENVLALDLVEGFTAILGLRLGVSRAEAVAWDILQFVLVRIDSAGTLGSALAFRGVRGRHTPKRRVNVTLCQHL